MRIRELSANICKMADGMSKTSRSKQVLNAAFDRVCSTFGIEKFHEEQQKALDMFFEGKDVFVSLPTGYGKSIIFQAIPVIASLLWKKKCTIFVVSPLKALMEDQVNYLNSLGLKAVALTDSEDGIMERVLNGEYTHVYGSPESFLAQDTWRDVFSSTTFKTHLVGVAIDEAHCISHWGLPGERSVPFREWFGNLGELRSLIPQEARLVVVTATATKSTRQKIYETLQLGPRQTVVVEKSPDRPNLKYSAIYINKSQPFEQIFSELIKELKDHGKMAERTMIYCQTRKQSAVIFRTFTLFLGDKLFNGNKEPKNRIVEMYHAGTPTSVKKHIIENLSKDDGHICCLITTVAFGMGVNCKKVRKIYHFGPAKNLECYVQESGRGGRDGMPASCILLYNGILSNHCEQDIKDYCKADQCRRDTLFAPFGEKPKQVIPKHNCCDNCALNCSCGLDTCKEAFHVEMSAVELPGSSQMKTRPVTSENKRYLRSALKKFRKDEVNKQFNTLDQLVSCPNVLLELGDFFIEQVLENCYNIFNVQDVFKYVEVWRNEHAIAIVNIISQCFGDIEEVAELDVELMEDIDIDMDWEELRDDSTLMEMAQSLEEDSYLTECDDTLIAATSLNTSSFLGSIVSNLP